MSLRPPMRPSVLRATLVVSIITTADIARAKDPAAECPCLWHRLHREETPPPGEPRFIPHTDERAGSPRALARHVEPSVTPGGIGYYVGGGVALGHGLSRRRDLGTWGWDETGGHRFRRRVILGWSQGRKYQGGTVLTASMGTYRRTSSTVPPARSTAWAGTKGATRTNRAGLGSRTLGLPGDLVVLPRNRGTIWVERVL